MLFSKWILQKSIGVSSATLTRQCENSWAKVMRLIFNQINSEIGLIGATCSRTIRRLFYEYKCQ